MDKRKRTRREGGFTLIELISVIVILGILAAVITPRYFDMTSKAQNAAYDAAMAEGTARFNLAFGKYIMEKSTKPAVLTDLVTADGKYLGTSTTVVIGDYQVIYTGGTGTAPAVAQVTLTLKKKNGAAWDAIPAPTDGTVDHSIRNLDWPGNN